MNHKLMNEYLASVYSADPAVPPTLKPTPLPECESEDLTPTPQWENVMPYLYCIAFWLSVIAGYVLYRILR